jgi:hypothetical protein
MMRDSSLLMLLATAGFAVACAGKPKLEEPVPQAEPTPAPAPPPRNDAPSPAATEFSVSAIEVGKGIGPDKRIAEPTTTFAPRDTIYVSVATEGAAPSKTITAKWSFQDGQVVSVDSLRIVPTGPAATEFHIVKPSEWPVGKYKVEIRVNGGAAQSKEFEVKSF